MWFKALIEIGSKLGFKISFDILLNYKADIYLPLQKHNNMSKLKEDIDLASIYYFIGFYVLSTGKVFDFFLIY